MPALSFFFLERNFTWARCFYRFIFFHGNGGRGFAASVVLRPDGLVCTAAGRSFDYVDVDRAPASRQRGPCGQLARMAATDAHRHRRHLDDRVESSRRLFLFFFFKPRRTPPCPAVLRSQRKADASCFLSFFLLLPRILRILFGRLLGIRIAECAEASPYSCYPMETPPKVARKIPETSSSFRIFGNSPGRSGSFQKSAFFFPFSVDQGSSRLRSKAFRSIPPNTSPITRALEKKTLTTRMTRANRNPIVAQSFKGAAKKEKRSNISERWMRWMLVGGQQNGSSNLKKKKTFLPIFIGFSSVFLFSILKTKVLPMVCRVFMEFSNVSSTF